MNWSVQIKEKAVKSLAKINRKDAETIWHFLENELPTMENPRQKGKALVVEFRGNVAIQNWGLSDYLRNSRPKSNRDGYRS